MGINGKAASDNHKKSFVPIKLCRGVPEQPYLFGQEYPGDSLPQGAGRDLLAGRCLGHPLRPQCPWVLLELSFSLFCWGVGPPHVLLWFCGDSVAIVPTLPHHKFSVREMGAPASLQPFLDILVGLWEIGQGWGMEGTGTCCGGGCVRSHPEMSGLPGMLEVGHQPASLSQGRIVLLAPVASCPGKP